MSQQKIENEYSRTFYLTVLNVLSCFGVIMLHCNDIYWQAPTGMLWISANFIETCFYFAVPIFFMISGCTLLEYRERYSTRKYFNKRFWKTVFPFLMWSFLAYVNQTRITIRDGGVADFNPLHVMDGILNTRYMQIYWFFIPLFAVYLAIPIFSAIQDKLRIFTYASVLGILLVSFLPLLSHFVAVPYNSGITPCAVNGYILLSILGYVLAERELKRSECICIYILGVLGWALHFMGTDWLSNPGTIDSTFKGYLNLPAVLQAAGVFVFMKQHTLKNAYIKTIIAWISGKTLGIYLIHFYTIRALTKILKVDTACLWWRTGGALLVFICSMCIVWMLQKIPFIKKMVP